VSTTAVLFLFAGLVVGGVIAWLAALSRAKGTESVNNELRQQILQKDSELVGVRRELDSERQTKARLEESQKYLQEERAHLEAMRKELSEMFKSISLDALDENSRRFLNLAKEALKAQTSEGKKELENKKELIDKNLESLDKTLSEVQKKIEEVGKGNIEVSTLVKTHEAVTSKLKETTEHLSRALASSKKRGEWGERMAEDIIKLVGMVEGVNYIKQKALEGSSGRPDFTFFMPNKLKINMDVKFPLDNYIHYVNAHSEHDKKRYKDELLKNTRVMIKQVTTRDYINPSDNTVDYVLVFIPNEQIYGFINESDITIIDEALKQKVVLCSPFTLYAVLAVIRQAAENFNLEQTASEMLKLLGEFSKQWNLYKDRFRTMGEKLDAAKKEYDTLVTTRSNMLERPLRKIDDIRKQKSISFNAQEELDEKEAVE
jgi:DNA recombination protein RmuC